MYSQLSLLLCLAGERVVSAKNLLCTCGGWPGTTVLKCTAVAPGKARLQPSGMSQSCSARVKFLLFQGPLSSPFKVF